MKGKSFLTVFARDFSDVKNKNKVEVFHLATVEPTGTVIVYCSGKVPLRKGWRRCFESSDPKVDDFARNNPRFTLCMKCVSKYRGGRLL